MGQTQARAHSPELDWFLQMYKPSPNFQTFPKANWPERLLDSKKNTVEPPLQQRDGSIQTTGH